MFLSFLFAYICNSNLFILILYRISFHGDKLFIALLINIEVVSKFVTANDAAISVLVPVFLSRCVRVSLDQCCLVEI